MKDSEDKVLADPLAILKKLTQEGKEIQHPKLIELVRLIKESGEEMVRVTGGKLLSDAANSNLSDEEIVGVTSIPKPTPPKIIT
jgi:hypothetical protein